MDEYWIAWGYTEEVGLWASFDTRAQAEERKRFWQCHNTRMKVFIYHAKEGINNVA